MSMLDGKELECAPDRDPVYYNEGEGKWFFYDESWVDSVGPYDTEQEARDALDRYCRDVLGHG